MIHSGPRRKHFRPGRLFGLACLVLLLAAQGAAFAQQCKTAEVVALDELFWLNRLGAVQPDGMIYAMARDVISDSHNENACPNSQPDPSTLTPGSVKLRRGVRPRPLVLRVNEGDCLDIKFTNLLRPAVSPPLVGEGDKPHEKDASIRVVGMQYQVQPEDGGMHIGNDPSGIVPPGGTRTYRIFAEKEGTYLMYSGGALTGGEAYGGSVNMGLFGAVNVQPKGSRYFRSQVTNKDLKLAEQTFAPLGWDPRFPNLNYTATYPSGSTDSDVCWQSGEPILEMTQGNKIIHSDLTAIVTGPDMGGWPDGQIPEIKNIYVDTATGKPNRGSEPFREFTIIFHDELGAVQAFPLFNDELMQHTLHSVRDAFAINYGTGGAGAEIIANRIGVGPMADCVDCRYEEFFLSAWTVGDPSMVVDTPANAPLTTDDVHYARNKDPDPGHKATVAYYPDDPSNVYHSYLNDRVKFRNLLAGTDDHHIFHLHAHQWLQTPNEDSSTYMDSQAIGQGTGFTYEIAYNGSGNRNLTPGDSIFHCHYYPHFAQGMWSMWRVHDTLETGTALDKEGRPVHKRDSFTGDVTTLTRALPDAEIKTGTPIPAIVPMPNLPMAPPPTAVRLVNGQIDQNYVLTQAQNAKSSGDPFFNPGYPFFVPGVAGERPPSPPMDFALDGSGNPRDGGLPRFIALDGKTVSYENRLNLTKHVEELVARWIPEQGTRLEQLAMETHEQSGFDTPAANGKLPPAVPDIEFNGMPRIQGAPFADPCRADALDSPMGFRSYEGVDIELDIRLNKEGWHFPQSRMSVLREDALPMIAGDLIPEPLFIRANSRECIEYQFTNLVPAEYQTDDFQVKTPTDVIGQHIHLVKFDVLASDGGSNGFNYQDGSLSPEGVQEIITAIRKKNGCAPGFTQTYQLGSDLLYCPSPVVDPRFGSGDDVNCDDKKDFLGAQTTVQRWWADPVRDNAGVDRTLKTVFTHDHFGPSTHQQVGLYAGLIVEKTGSTWFHNENGTQLGIGRQDGGPTSWQARIENGTDSFREFLLEYGDFQLAYEQPTDGCYKRQCPDKRNGLAQPKLAINPPGRIDNEAIVDLYNKPVSCPVNEGDEDGTATTMYTDTLLPCPEAVSAHDPGFISVNYRTEPLALRLADSPGSSPNQNTEFAGDPSFAYETRTDRGIPSMNNKPFEPGLRCVGYGPLTDPSDLYSGDPFTPIMRTYEGDDVKIRVLVGAHEEEHNLSLNGLKWLRQEDYEDSGYRDSQMMGISEHFELNVGAVPSMTDGKVVDVLYRASAASEWQWNGAWGLIRAHAGKRDDLRALNDNPLGKVDQEQKDAAFGVADRAKTDPSSDEMKEPGRRPTDEYGAQKASLGSQPAPALPQPVSCPKNAPVRSYDVTAVAAREALPQVPSLGGRRSLVFNRRDGANNVGPIHDPTQIMFVPTQDLIYNSNRRPELAANAPVEPLVLRAAAGECLEVTLRNDLPPSDTANPITGWAGFGFDMLGWSGWHMIIEHFNANHISPSMEVGLHPQLVAYDPAKSDGMNIGRNPMFYGKQTVAPGEKITYYWYAGHHGPDSTGTMINYPIEFGATGLTSSDVLEHTNKGAVGALIIEPQNAILPPAFNDRHSYLTDDEDRITRAETTINMTDGTSFREYVTIFQNDINQRYSRDVKDSQDPLHPDDPLEKDAIPNLTVFGDPTESGQKAFNYRTEPTWFRLGENVGFHVSPIEEANAADQDRMLTDAFIGNRRPVTPIFTAKPNQPVRFRVVHPGGHTQASVFEVQGHLWQEFPYTSVVNPSDTIGYNPTSQHEGTRYGMGPSDHDDIIPLHGAGGLNGIPAEYIYRDYVPWYFGSGLWGLFEVKDSSTGGGGGPKDPTYTEEPALP